MREKKIVVWFRNDLRLHDQEALYRAAAKTARVIPVYCFDPRQFGKTPLGFPKTGPFRAQFLLESVAALRASLRSIGADLVVRVGKPEEILPNLVEMTGASAVYASKEVAEEEVKVENNLEAKLWAKNIPLELFWTSTLFHIDDIPYPIKNIPDVFTEFRKESEKSTRVRPVFPAPSTLTLETDIHPGALPSLSELGIQAMPEADPRAVMTFQGGEPEALNRLQTYFWEEDRLSVYKETRNGLVGAGYSTKFSAWLSYGCLSPRKVYEEVKRYEQERVANDSTYWVVFELLWRDYFRFIAKKYGSAIFRPEGIRNDQRLVYSNDVRLFSKWVDGETGVPFVDANMRELKLTGFMSNRGRQNVASFLVRDLKVNWTYGAAYFESQLLDYDVSQAKRYDPQGEYVKRWLPELAEVPPSRVHQVSDLSREEQRRYGTVLGADYPLPIVKYGRLPART